MMTPRKEIIKANIQNIQQRIKKAAEKSGRSAKEITLLAVTKYVSLDDMRYAIDAGIRAVGESKIQDAKQKFYQLGPVVDWHLIGHLQTNKARQAAAIFKMIHSIDSPRIADALDREAGRLDRRLDVLVEVNISQEESKFGIKPEETKQLAAMVAQKEHLRLRGLMTMAPYVENQELVRPYFRALKGLFEEIKIKQDPGPQWNTLSMGMSNDFEIALEEGATMVRIGTSLFAG